MNVCTLFNPFTYLSRVILPISLVCIKGIRRIKVQYKPNHDPLSIVFTILFVPYSFLYYIFRIIKMREVNHKVDLVVSDLNNTMILPTDRMTQETSDRFHNSIDLLCSNNHIMIFASPYILSTMDSSHFTNLPYRFPILHIWNLIGTSLKRFDMCLKDCTFAN